MKQHKLDVTIDTDTGVTFKRNGQAVTLTFDEMRTISQRIKQAMQQQKAKMN